MAGFNVGSNTTLQIVINGATFSHSIMTSFNAKQKTKQLQSIGIDSINRFEELPQGWDGTFMWDRADSALDEFFAAAETAYYSGAPTPTASIIETTTNPDGSVTQMRYPNVVMKFADIGDRKGDALVVERVDWVCSFRQFIG